MRRYLEIVDGVATHELRTGGVLPAEVWYCACVLGETWNPQAPPADADGQPMSLAAWQSAHAAHGATRHLLVEVTRRTEARLGMTYDEVADRFSL